MTKNRNAIRHGHDPCHHDPIKRGRVWIQSCSHHDGTNRGQQCSQAREYNGRPEFAFVFSEVIITRHSDRVVEKVGHQSLVPSGRVKESANEDKLRRVKDEVMVFNLLEGVEKVQWNLRNVVVRNSIVLLVSNRSKLGLPINNLPAFGVFVFR